MRAQLTVPAPSATTPSGPSQPARRTASAAPARRRTTSAHRDAPPHGRDDGDHEDDVSRDDATRNEATRDEPPRHTPTAMGDDAGAVAVELTLLAPLFVLLLLFVVAVGRVTSARITVQDLARHAARTLTVDPAGPSTDRARRSALDEANRNGLTCKTLTVTTVPPAAPAAGAADPAASPAATPPGGAVTVRVSCTVTLGDLTGLFLPSTADLTATATSPLDRYRGTP